MQKKYLIDYPELLKDFDPTLNVGIEPAKVTKGQHIKIQWKCHKCGYVWMSCVFSRTLGRGCPKCAGKVCDITESLTVHEPNFAKAWKFDENSKRSLDPTKIKRNSRANAIWKCQECSHVFERKVCKVISNPICPKCGSPLFIKKGSLKDKNPIASKLWDYDRNNDYPEVVMNNSNKKYFFKCAVCKKNIIERSLNKLSKMICPECQKKNRTSLREQTILYYARKYFYKYDVISRYKPCNKQKKTYEIDVFIKKLKVGIAYDGKVHKEKENDLRKHRIIRSNGVTLYVISEVLKPENVEAEYSDYYTYISSKNSVYYKNEFSKQLEQLFEKIANIAGENIYLDINVVRDEQKIYQQYYNEINSFNHSESIKSYLNHNKNDKVLLEFDNQKNILELDEIPHNSVVEVYWRCSKCNHEWKTSVYKRVIQKHGCPVCAHRLLKPGVNDLKTLLPELIEKKWDFQSNDKEGIYPHNFFISSKEEVYWLNDEGESYKAKIVNITTNYRRKVGIIKR